MKKTKDLRFENEVAGITLISLVVTIIVLLILAGVSINLIFSNDGIIKKAQEAANAQNEAVESDKAGLESLGEQANTLLNGRSNTQIETYSISLEMNVDGGNDGLFYSLDNGESWNKAIDLPNNRLPSGLDVYILENVSQIKFKIFRV